MSITRKWWEPVSDDHRSDSERRPRPSFDLDNLLSLAIGGGEFGHFAELLCSADRQPARPFPQGAAPTSDQGILG